MQLAGFEPAIPASDQPQIHVYDLAASGKNVLTYLNEIFLFSPTSAIYLPGLSQLWKQVGATDTLILTRHWRQAQTKLYGDHRNRWKYVTVVLLPHRTRFLQQLDGCSIISQDKNNCATERCFELLILYTASVIDEWMSTEHWMILAGENWGTGGRNFPVSFGYHKDHTEYPGIDHGSPRWEAEDTSLLGDGTSLLAENKIYFLLCMKREYLSRQISVTHSVRWIREVWKIPEYHVCSASCITTRGIVSGGSNVVIQNSYHTVNFRVFNVLQKK